MRGRGPTHAPSSLLRRLLVAELLSPPALVVGRELSALRLQVADVDGEVALPPFEPGFEIRELLLLLLELVEPDVDVGFDLRLSEHHGVLALLDLLESGVHGRLDLVDPRPTLLDVLVIRRGELLARAQLGFALDELALT